MMNFVKLTATNFLSFKELNYDFETKPILIQGENTSDDAQESNGSGKSALQAAIEFCLYKTTSRKVLDVELINYDDDFCSVQLNIFCSIRKELLQIERTIKRKAGTTLRIKINTENQSFATIEDGNKLILSWIDITREDLQNYFILNKERYVSFFSSSNKQKIEMINRFSNAKLINGIEKNVEADILQEETKLTNLLKQETATEASITTLKERLVREQDRDFEEEKKIRINEVNNEITWTRNQINDIITSSQELYFKSANSLEDLNKLLVDVDLLSTQVANFKSDDFTEKYNKINEAIETLNERQSQKTQEENKTRANISEINTTIASIEKNLKGTVVCPNCNHEFNIADPTLSIEEEKVYFEQVTNLLIKVKDKLRLIALDTQEIQNSIGQVRREETELRNQENLIIQEKRKLNKQVDDLNRLVSSKSDELNNIKITIANNNTKINSLEEMIILKYEKIKEIETLQDDGLRIKELEAGIKELKKGLLKINSDIEAQKQKIYYISQWIINFKNFNIHLANISLMAIQSNCNKFLKDIGLDIQIKMEGQKLIDNGKKLKEEITPYIVRDNTVRDFWSFSGGERARLDYTMILTMQKMINSTHKYGGLNFLSTDEVGEGLDSQGLADLMKAFHSLNKAILITTHVVNRSISENVLLIRKENKVSRIVKN
jgi:DNA repair exonuclease SbcCD ATPase subunit